MSFIISFKGLNTCYFMFTYNTQWI